MKMVWWSAFVRTLCEREWNMRLLLERCVRNGGQKFLNSSIYSQIFQKWKKIMRLLDHKCCNKMALRCVFILIYVFYVRMCGGVMVVVFREGYKKQKGGGGVVHPFCFTE